MTTISFKGKSIDDMDQSELLTAFKSLYKLHKDNKTLLVKLQNLMNDKTDINGDFKEYNQDERDVLNSKWGRK